MKPLFPFRALLLLFCLAAPLLSLGCTTSLSPGSGDEDSADGSRDKGFTVQDQSSRPEDHSTTPRDHGSQTPDQGSTTPDQGSTTHDHGIQPDSALLCGAGQYLANQRCVDVGPGYYSPSNSNSRYRCQTGTYSARTNESSATCTPCPLPSHADRGHVIFHAWGTSLPSSSTGIGCQIVTMACLGSYYATTSSPKRCVDPKNHVKLMTWNIRLGLGNHNLGTYHYDYTNTAHIGRIVTEIVAANPDVVSLQEVSNRSEIWDRPYSSIIPYSYLNNQAVKIRDLLKTRGINYYVIYSWYTIYGSHDMGGNAILSKFPASNIHRTAQTYAWPTTYPGICRGGPPLLDCVLTPHGDTSRRFAIFSAHFPNFVSPETNTHRGQPAFDIAKRMRTDDYLNNMSYDDLNVPIIVAGDLNTRLSWYHNDTLAHCLDKGADVSPLLLLDRCRNFKFNPTQIKTCVYANGAFNFQLDFIGLNGEGTYAADRWYSPKGSDTYFIYASDHRPIIMDMIYIK